jgi:hypothetical protein
VENKDLINVLTSQVLIIDVPIVMDSLNLLSLGKVFFKDINIMMEAPRSGLKDSQILI